MKQAVPPLSKIDRETKAEPEPTTLSQFVQGTQAARRGLENPLLDSFRLMRQTTWLLISAAMLLTVTQFIFIWFTSAGLVLLTISLAALTTLAIFKEEARGAAISMAILPITELARASIITHSAFQSAAVFYGMLLVLVLPYRYLFTLDEPVTFTQLKLKGHIFGLPLMLVLGEALGIVGYLLLKHHYPYHGIPLPIVCMSALIFAFAEEMFLRGLVQQQASRVVHPLIAAGMTAVLYIPLATTHTGLLALGPAIAMGFVLAAVYHVKHNLLLSTAINAAAKLTYIGLVAAFVMR